MISTPSFLLSYEIYSAFLFPQVFNLSIIPTGGTWDSYVWSLRDNRGDLGFWSELSNNGGFLAGETGFAGSLARGLPFSCFLRPQCFKRICFLSDQRHFILTVILFLFPVAPFRITLTLLINPFILLLFCGLL